MKSNADTETTAPPLNLSSLPQELLEVIVGKIASDEDLRSLCLVQRKFTSICQARLFEVFHLAPDKRRMQTKLRKGFPLFQQNPALARLVRCIRIKPEGANCGWVFHDHIFMASMQLLSQSRRPPTALEIIPESHGLSIFRDRTFIIRRMLQTFLPTSLTTLVVKGCWNIPLTLFLLSPHLRTVELEDTKLSKVDLDIKAGLETDESSVNQPPEEHEENAWYERDAPALTELRYGSSGQVISAFLDPPSHAPGGVVKLSELRRLSVNAEPVNKGWKRLQRILNGAQASLIDLEISFSQIHRQSEISTSLSGRLDLSALGALRTLCLPLLIQSRDTKHQTVVKGLSSTLSTLPNPNRLSSLTISCTEWASDIGPEGLDIVLSQNWAGLGTELIRIAAGGRLDVTVQFAWGGILSQDQYKDRSRIRSHLTDELSFVANMPTMTLQVVDLEMPTRYR